MAKSPESLPDMGILVTDEYPANPQMRFVRGEGGVIHNQVGEGVAYICFPDLSDKSLQMVDILVKDTLGAQQHYLETQADRLYASHLLNRPHLIIETLVKNTAYRPPPTNRL